MKVFVRDNNVDQALRILKKKLLREGLFRLQDTEEERKAAAKAAMSQQ